MTAPTTTQDIDQQDRRRTMAAAGKLLRESGTILDLAALLDALSGPNGDFIRSVLYHADGTEGALITGLQYVAGKNGIDADNNLFTVDRNTGLAVSKGLVTGEKFVHKFFANEDVDAGTEDVWSYGGTLSYLTSAETMDVGSGNAADAGTVVSSGTATGGTTTTLIDTGATFVSDGVAVGDIVINDTQNCHGIVASIDSEIQVTVTLAMNRGSQSKITTGFTNTAGDTYRIATPASTGAATVVIYGLDDDWNEILEYIVLNGESDVTTTLSYLGIYRMIVLTAGSGQSAAVDILATASVAATVQAHIAAANGNKTQMSQYRIPAGYTAYLMHSTASVGGGAGVNTADVKMKVEVAPFGEVFEMIDEDGASGGGSSFMSKPYSVPLRIPEKSIIRVRATTDSDNTNVYGTYCLRLLEN